MKYPFARKQIVVVGELLRLRPVPSRFDDGSFMFTCQLYQFAIPYVIELKTVMRQEPDEKELITALRDEWACVQKRLKHSSKGCQQEATAISRNPHTSSKKFQPLLYTITTNWMSSVSMLPFKGMSMVWSLLAKRHFYWKKTVRFVRDTVIKI